MSVSTLKRLFGWLLSPITDDPLFYECRYCGMSFDVDPDKCPLCGAESIASYHPSPFK